jgi:hypothetical protein
MATRREELNQIVSSLGGSTRTSKRQQLDDMVKQIKSGSAGATGAPREPYNFLQPKSLMENIQKDLPTMTRTIQQNRTIEPDIARAAATPSVPVPQNLGEVVQKVSQSPNSVKKEIATRIKDTALNTGLQYLKPFNAINLVTNIPAAAIDPNKSISEATKDTFQASKPFAPENRYGSSGGANLVRAFKNRGMLPDVTKVSDADLMEIYNNPAEPMNQWLLKQYNITPQGKTFEQFKEEYMSRARLTSDIEEGVADFVIDPGAVLGIAGKGVKTLRGMTKGTKTIDKVADTARGLNRVDDIADTARITKISPEEILPNNPPAKQKNITPDGTRPIGAEPDIPTGQRERGFSTNTRTDVNNPDELRNSFSENPLTYEQISGTDTTAKAQVIYDQGYSSARTQLDGLLKDMKPESVPLAKMLAREATNIGNIGEAREVLSNTALRLTEAGQFTQAARLLRESDPETFLMTIDKQLRKLNEQGLKQYGKKWTNIDLLPDEITSIQSIPRGNQQAYEEVWEQIGSRIAKDLPSTGMEKFDAWRRMAMLLNPKTHIRNTVGNVIMSGMRKVSDTIGAGLEKLFGVKTGERTKSFGWSLNKNIASKVDETWDIVKKDILGESRWEIDNLKSLGQEKRIFKKGLPTKAVEAITGHKFDRGALQWVNELSLKTLNAEDNIFTKRAFKDALGQFMQ